MMEENCHVDPIQKSPSEAERKVEQVATLGVWGMGCPNCANRVRNSLISINGVVDADVDHLSGIAQVIYNPHMVQTQALIDAVGGAGNDGRHRYGAQLLGQ
jgi:copper chaperone CopZ